MADPDWTDLSIKPLGRDWEHWNDHQRVRITGSLAGDAALGSISTGNIRSGRGIYCWWRGTVFKHCSLCETRSRAI